MKTPRISRRTAVSGAGAAVVTMAAAQLQERLAAEDKAASLKGRVKHSVCKWCYKDISLENLCLAAKEIGLTSIDLMSPGDFPTLKQHGLHCAMVAAPSGDWNGKKVGGIPLAFNRTEHHDVLVQIYEPLLKASAEAGFNQVICFSGNRSGLDDEQGLGNCAAGLKRLMGLCEKLGVTLVMELLNSKVNHKDYQCDHTAWGVELCKRVGSERFKLLYDIYHMQIMEGDVIATIQQSHPYIAHYHSGGVPGRHEIDESQELYYPAIVKAIVATGYQGYVAQEFIPARPDALGSLRQAVGICDV